MMYQQPIHRDAVRAREQRFPFLAAQIERQALRPGDPVRRRRPAAAPLREDFVHERFGDFVEDVFDGVVAEDVGVGDEGVPGEPDEVGELVEVGDVLGDFGGGDAAPGDFVAGADG